jgi:hypothetical protein
LGSKRGTRECSTDLRIAEDNWTRPDGKRRRVEEWKEGEAAGYKGSHGDRERRLRIMG